MAGECLTKTKLGVKGIYRQITEIDAQLVCRAKFKKKKKNEKNKSGTKKGKYPIKVASSNVHITFVSENYLAIINRSVHPFEFIMGKWQSACPN